MLSKVTDAIYASRKAICDSISACGPQDFEALCKEVLTQARGVRKGLEPYYTMIAIEYLKENESIVELQRGIYQFFED